ncbi:hypothetical protein J6Y73_02070 [bacterium]|nr:hypothetical protein [bacterium]
MNEIRIDKAISFLKQEYTLESIIDNKITRFKYINNNIFISSDNAYYYLDEYEFIELFKDYSFSITDNVIDYIDEERDKEYYNIPKIKK